MTSAQRRIVRRFFLAYNRGMNDDRATGDLADPYTLAVLYKAGLTADNAGLAALAKHREAMLPKARPVATVEHASSVRVSPVVAGGPRKLTVATATPVRVAPGTPYFERRGFEYRALAGTNNVYEYNRLTPGGKAFAEGAVADGYVTLGEDGGFSRPHVSYAMLDEDIKRDLRLIGEGFDVPLRGRDHSYYTLAEAALLSLDRIVVAPDETTVEVVSDGRRWRVKLESGYRVRDRAEGELHSFADVETPGRLYTHVELKVDGTSREVYLYDRGSGIGRVGSIPYEHLSDVTDGVPKPPVAETAPSVIGAGFVSDVPQPPQASGVPPSSDQTTDYRSTPPATAPAAPHTPPSEVRASIVPPPRIEPFSAGQQASSGKTLGTLRLVAETVRDDGGMEQIFALPFGKANVVIVYGGTGAIERIAAQSSEFMYPAAELLPEWEHTLGRKRREVGKFTSEDESADLLAAKRAIVERARERMLFRKLTAGLPADSPELSAAVSRMQEIARDTIEHYGAVFAVAT